MMKKIIIATCILLMLTGIAYAADIRDYKLPDKFKAENENWASNGDYGISIGEFKDSDYDFYFKSNSDSDVVIANNIANYTSTTLNSVGCDEIVEINGEKVLIESYITGTNPNKITQCYENLIEFNKLNQLTPLEIQ